MPMPTDERDAKMVAYSHAVVQMRVWARPVGIQGQGKLRLQESHASCEMRGDIAASSPQSIP